MCDGTLFDDDIKTWCDFREAAAAGEHGFDEAPTRSGVYVLRVRKATSTDLDAILRAFNSSAFMRHATQLDEESERFFRALGLGDGDGDTPNSQESDLRVLVESPSLEAS